MAVSPGIVRRHAPSDLCSILPDPDRYPGHVDIRGRN